MLLILDISNIAHRAAHTKAFQSFSTRSGQSTNVVYGSLMAICSLIEKFSPQSIIACFDGGSPRRLDLLSQYKATRKESQERDRVKSQIPILKRVLEHTPINCLYKQGLEADDLIEIIHNKFVDNKLVIVSKDLDLCQLITEKHKLVAPNGEVVEAPIDPKLVAAYKSLVGDSSDNIPGIPKVGPKTAKKLLKTRTLKDVILEAKRTGSICNTPYKEAVSIIKRNFRLVKLGKLVTKAEREEVVAALKERRYLNKEKLIQFLKGLDFGERTINKVVAAFDQKPVLAGWRSK